MYRLHIGDPTYSSWSLRGWLVFARFGLSCDLVPVDFAAGDVAAQLAGLPPAATVPALQIADGPVLWDSLAIAEELASRHPDAGHWPDDRATARALAAEMHASFTALRADCPMNLRVIYEGFAPSEAVRADLARLARLWDYALDRSGGPWLCGRYSVADAFYAPVATRIVTYDLPVPAAMRAYVDRHLGCDSLRAWRRMARDRGQTLARYAKDLPSRDWPDDPAER